MAKDKRMIAIGYAILAAVFYAVNVPVSKVLLREVGPTTMAALLYLGAGVGIGMLSLFSRNSWEKSEPLSKKDLPYVIGMIVLDIAAPIFLMLGISYGSSANASLLGNFEIVATTLIALFIFREAVSKRLWAAIALITLSSILLSFEGTDSFRFSYGSLFVLLATVCWGFENNCTRNIASKSTCCLWPEHIFLCLCAARSRSSKNKCLLCCRTICRSIFIVCISERAAVVEVSHSTGSDDCRIRTGCCGHSDPAACTSACSHLYAYP